MKIPETVRIGGIDYRIEQADGLNNGREVLDGRMDAFDSVIKLTTENGHQHRCIILWHEMLHAIAVHASLELGDKTELIIDTFAYGIYQILQDNARKLFDIKED